MAQSFIIPPQGAIDRRRRLADVLAQESMSTDPVQSWTQGAARIAQGLAGALGNYRANQMEGQRNSALAEALKTGTPEALMNTLDPQLLHIAQIKMQQAQDAAQLAHQQRMEERQARADALANQHWQQNFDQNASQFAETQAFRKESLAHRPPTTRLITLPDGSQQMVQLNEQTGQWDPAPLSQAAGANPAQSNPNHAAPIPKMTEGEQKSFRFYRRARNSNDLSPAEEQALASGTQNALNYVPYGIGNAAHSTAYQTGRQKADKIIGALNYSDSGAQIGEKEFDRNYKTLFPVYGDGPEVIAQKRKARADAIASLKMSSGRAAAYLNQEDQARAEAKDAIAKGAPIDQVKKRLQDNGFDTEGF